MGDVLRCVGLRRSFDDLVAVADVGFAIRPGETYGLLGPNGAGKTTTINMVAGLLTPDTGEIEVAGHAMTPRERVAKAHVGLVPQDLAIYPDLSARENLRFFGRLHAVARTELDRRVDEVLEVIGLRDRADDRTDEYSGGMKRRLNIGIGMLHRPTLLILDEPTVGVDPQSRNAILDAVERLAGTGMGILYTTHYMEEAERLCDRIGIIDEGTLQAEGTRPDLVAMVGRADRVSLTTAGAAGAALQPVQALPQVREASTTEDGLVLTVDHARQVLPALLRTVSDAGVSVTGVAVEEPDLETVFLHLTGKALRD